MNKILYLSTLLVTIIFYGCATSGPGINNIKAELPNSPITSEIKDDQILEEDSTVAQIDEEVSENNNQSDSEITDDMISPLIEKKETIVATGYAVVSVQNHDTASQQRLLAIRASKLEAYRSLVEQVYGQYLDASTTIADMVVMRTLLDQKLKVLFMVLEL